ncbi:MAG: N-acetylmuramoyl-L-alanine amidase, partial [Thermodesulfovibrionales bacterium]|nr:N-acetylmuramoyl-L-alanine amidase [Thermodesulfovibrionales bacterium]
MRKAILRGVYEDNLRIIGKNPVILAGRAPIFFKKMFLFFSITLLSILVNGNYLNLPLFPEKQTTASLITQRPSSLPAEKPVKPSDYAAFLGGKEMPLSRMFGLEVKTIMIDPGHGGSDSGTTGTMGTKEKDITLDIAKKLRERLRKYGRYNILITREQDTTLPLNQRVELARSSRADIFISIHLNYLPSKPINIIETYYFGPSADDKTLRLAE